MWIILKDILILIIFLIKVKKNMLSTILTNLFTKQVQERAQGHFVS